MSTRTEIQFLESVLEQSLALEEGLITEQAVDAYVGRLCDELEAVGYEIPEEFDLGEFLEVVERTIQADSELSEAQKGLFARMRGALKGALKGATAKGLAAAPKFVHTAFRRHHAKAAEKAMDAGDTKAYTHHYQQQVFHRKHEAPKDFKAAEAHRKSYEEPRIGSKKDARWRMKLAKAAKPLHAQWKADAPAQAKAHHAALAGTQIAKGGEKEGHGTVSARAPKAAPSGEKTAQVGTSATYKSHGMPKTVTHHAEPVTVKAKAPVAAKPGVTKVARASKTPTAVTKAIRPRF